MRNPWTPKEIELIVADYVGMLIDEIEGRQYNKTKHRQMLISQLNNRSNGSIERKHQNISAVLIENGYPYIDGYKPLANYQKYIFPKVVLESIKQDRRFNTVLETDNVSRIPEPSVTDILSIFEDAPVLSLSKPYDNVQSTSFMAHSNPVDYLVRESQNRDLGLAGEKLVLNYERARLIFDGKESLSEKIEHTSLIIGDGTGYDIRSYNVDGSDRFIEVKTTKYGKNIPFFISRNEVNFSGSHADNFNLYRVFNFKKIPRMYIVNGSVESRFHLDPMSYKAFL